MRSPKRPTGQAVQFSADVAPVTAAKVPRKQSEQLEIEAPPSRLLKRPAGHSRQLVAPWESAYLPGPHGSHDLARS